jgi:7-cyano-7-deazaguanine synthase
MSDPKPTSILLASGGLDSTTLAFWLVSKDIPFVPLFIDYGQHCAATERKRLAEVLPRGYADAIQTINVRDIYSASSSRLIDEANLWEDRVAADDLYLPYRNLLLLSVAAAFAQARGCREVYAAFINSNHAKEIDCSAAFFDRLGEMLADFGTVQVRMPFRELSKREVAKIGLSLSAPIAKTFSCQAASVVPCGACPNCVERLEALRQLSAEPKEGDRRDIGRQEERADIG